MSETQIPQEIEKGQKQSEALYRSFSNQFINTMQEISKLADKRASTFLIALGTVIVIVALAMKLQLFGQSVGTLHPSEFIAIIVLSALLVGGGSYMRIYQDASSRKTGAEFSDKAFDFAERVIEISKPADQKDL